MQVLTNVVNFFLGLGALIFVPIITIVGSIMARMKIKDVISSGITLSVAFTGMNLLISLMKDNITPVAQATMTSMGISLPIADGGWSTMATISWAWPYAFLMFPLLITVNVVMMPFNKTNTINADLWNVWLKTFTAVTVVSITHSVILVFVIAVVQIILELRFSDAHQHRIEKLTGTPGVSVIYATLLLGAILYPIALILRKIPGFNRESDTDILKDKVGIFAENHAMGLVLGYLFGILTKYSLAQIFTIGIKVAAATTLLPVAAKYFMQTLSPISEAVSAFMNKKSEGKTLIVGLDWSILGGCDKIWLVILWSIPFTPIYSMVLPGNETLPFAGLMSVSLALLAFLVTRGNLLQMSALCVVGASVFLWVGTVLAPLTTELAITTGSIDLQAGELISNSLISGPVFAYSISHLFMFLKGNLMPLIILVVWLVGFILYYRDLVHEVREDTALEAGNAKAGQRAIELTR